MKAMALVVCAVLPAVANAAVIGVATSNDGKQTVSLTDEQTELCKPWNGYRVIWTDGVTSVEGCYFVKEGEARINLLDWDQTRIPVQAFKKPKSA